MPYYEYECESCKEQFEVEQSIKEPRGATCPKCGSRTEKRLIAGGGGFALKGGGWYADGYSK